MISTHLDQVKPYKISISFLLAFFFFGSMKCRAKLTQTTFAIALWILCMFAVAVVPCHAQSQSFVYVCNSGSDNISAYSVNPTTGFLTPIPGSPFSTGPGPHSIVVDPSSRFAYVANENSDTISAYSINPTGGALLAMNGSPFISGSNPTALVMDPLGRFIYAVYRFSNIVSGFVIDPTTGALTPVSGSPFTMVGSDSGFSGAIDPQGKFLYVASNQSGNIAVFSIDGISGSLTPISGSPLPAGSNLAQTALHPTGRFLYVTDFGGGFGEVLGFTIDSTTGALTPISGSVGNGVGPAGIAIDPSGQFLYVGGEFSDGVLAYSIDSATGALTLVDGSPFPSGNFPEFLATDPSGKFLFAPNVFNNTVSAYSIDTTTGSLNAAPGSPFLAGSHPEGIATAVGGPTIPIIVLPDHGGNTGSVTVRITGSGFETGAQVKLAATGQPDIVGANPNVPDSTTLTATFDLTGATPGPRDVVITQPDGATLTLPQGFTIEQGGAPQIWVDIIGRDKIRIGREATFTFVFGNRGNIDSGATLFAFTVPKLGGFLSSQPFQDFLIDSYQTDQGVFYIYAQPNVPAGATGTFSMTLTASNNPQGNTPFQLRIQAESLEQFVSVVSSKAISQQSALASTPTTSAQSQSFVCFASLINLFSGPNLYDQCPQFQCSPPMQACPDCDPQWNALQANQNIELNAIAALRLARTGLFLGFNKVLTDVEVAVLRAIAIDKATKLIDTKLLKVDSEKLDALVSSGIDAILQQRKDGTDPSLGFTHATEMFQDFTAEFNLIQLLIRAGKLTEAQTAPYLLAYQILTDAMKKLIEEWPLLKPDGDAVANAQRIVDSADLQLCSSAQANEVCRVQNCNLPPTPPAPPPPPGGPGQGGIGVTPTQSVDPNDKVGSHGAGIEQYISGATPLRYAIYFENEDTATAPAQIVVITDQLDLTKDDLKTLSFGPIVFGDQFISPPPLQTNFSTTVDLRPTNNLLVAVDAILDSSTGLVTWKFTSLDPATGLPIDPSDPAGFLPPGGEGNVVFTVMPKQGLPTNTETQNQASIVFDVNDPIDTPVWLNTLDNTKPVSHVLPLAPTQNSPSFTVEWSGTDEGSGIQSYTIFASEDGGPFTPFLSNTTDTSATFDGQPGKTYAFYSVARDQTGNVEDAPDTPDATITTAPPPTPTPTPPPAVTCNGHALTMGCTVNGVANQLCQGTIGDDTIIGTDGPDAIHGLAGNDTINGLGGNDVICGGNGNDTINGGGDDDFIRGGPGADTLEGDIGNDTLNGNQGNDSLLGGMGNDTLDGGDGIDRCTGGAGSGDTTVNCEFDGNFIE